MDQDKRYIPGPETAPIVTQIFHDYASGVSMQKICDQLNAQGIRTTRGYRFTPKNLNKMLKNRAYIGEYAYGGHVHEDGMPRIVDDLTFNEVQRRFAINKRRGAKTKAELAVQGENAPDYLAHRQGVLSHLRRANGGRERHLEDRQDISVLLLPQSAQKEVLSQDRPQG
ncbi:recombinase family protein [Corynebacterium argentoratense]|uniref:recombinase family protein n=1 Tax=Corynebacterium argentoratense TaxID=42817 RepID=UPI0028ECAD2C|nr:recombinase family protein [Corynebacterium argentoratense]